MIHSGGSVHGPCSSCLIIQTCIRLPVIFNLLWLSLDRTHCAHSFRKCYLFRPFPGRLIEARCAPCNLSGEIGKVLGMLPLRSKISRVIQAYYQRDYAQVERSIAAEVVCTAYGMANISLMFTLSPALRLYS